MQMTRDSDPLLKFSHRYSQVQRVEEKDEVFSLEVSQAQVLELPVVDSCGLKVRSRLSDSRGPSGGA